MRITKLILNRKSEIIVTAVPLKHTSRWTVTRVAFGAIKLPPNQKGKGQERKD